MIRQKIQPSEHTIDTTGPDGNAVALIKAAVWHARQLGLDGEAIKVEMMAGDYDNLLSVFDNHFGEIITLEVGKNCITSL